MSLLLAGVCRFAAHVGMQKNPHYCSSVSVGLRGRAGVGSVLCTEKLRFRSWSGRFFKTVQKPLLSVLYLVVFTVAQFRSAQNDQQVQAATVMGSSLVILSMLAFMHAHELLPMFRLAWSEKATVTGQPVRLLGSKKAGFDS